MLSNQINEWSSHYLWIFLKDETWTWRRQYWLWIFNDCDVIGGSVWHFSKDSWSIKWSFSDAKSPHALNTGNYKQHMLLPFCWILTVEFFIYIEMPIHSLNCWCSVVSIANLLCIWRYHMIESLWFHRE